MKLLKPGSCQWEPGGGNVKMLTALGDAFADISSDRGSTPLASTIITPAHIDYYIDINMGRGFYYFINGCRQDVK